MSLDGRWSFGEEFCEQVNAATERQQADWQPPSRFVSRLARWSRLYWWLIGRCAHIDLYGGLQTYDDPKNYWKWKRRENFDPRYSTVNKSRWWALLAFLMYAYATVGVITTAYFQYLYDFNYMRLQVFKSLTTRDNELDVMAQVQSNSGTPFISYLRSIFGQTSQQSETGAADPVDRRELMLVQSNRSSLGNNALNELSHLLTERVRITHINAITSGSIFVNLHFIMQVVYVFLCGSSTVLVFMVGYYYNRVKPFDFGLTRAMLDLKHERRLQNRLIVDEINKFIESSRVYAKTCVARLERTENEGGWSQVGDQRNEASVRQNKVLLNYILTRRQLKQLALSGTLLPKHRTAKWVDAASLATFFMNLFSLIYAIIQIIFFNGVFFAMNGNIPYDWRPGLIIFLVAVSIQYLMILPVALLILSHITANCVDQTYYCFNICKQTHKCIESIWRLYYRSQKLEFPAEQLGPEDPARRPLLRANSSILAMAESLETIQRQCQVTKSAWARRLSEQDLLGAQAVLSFHVNVSSERAAKNASPVQQETLSVQNSLINRSLMIEAHHTQMNSEFLKVFMQNKVFITQIKPLARSFGAFAGAFLALLFAITIDIRMHSSYVDHATKVYFLAINVILVLAADVCLVPLSYMNARCQELYKSQSSLLAHIVEISDHRNMQWLRYRKSTQAVAASSAAQNEPAQIFDPHTMLLLRKELNHPQQLVNQFAIRALFIRLTHSNLLRMHFYVGIIGMSMIMDTSGSQDFFGRMFNDPWGVFNWRPDKLSH